MLVFASGKLEILWNSPPVRVCGFQNIGRPATGSVLGGSLGADDTLIIAARKGSPRENAFASILRFESAKIRINVAKTANEISILSSKSIFKVDQLLHYSTSLAGLCLNTDFSVTSNVGKPVVPLAVVAPPELEIGALDLDRWPSVSHRPFDEIQHLRYLMPFSFMYHS
ncbi:hypothetical protein N7475_006616 [Penicillium sp. IBT 31633x]|nr:hypothetical protein N7475_006616 [Penicillium sp. IBT 31633x]